MTLPFIIFVVLIPACSTAPQKPESLPCCDYNYTKRYISWLIKDKMVEHDIVGLSIALVDDQQMVWAEGFGWADEKQRIKATPETVYRAGSITKLFTATAAMQLAEQGKLDIDQPLEKYLPRFSIKRHFENDNPITPRQIMTHHSGLPTNYLRGMWMDEPTSFTQLVELLREDYTAYPPDTILSYSNLAMTLLGHMVQEVSGQPYAEYVKQSLLVPMGMSASYIVSGLKKGPPSAKGYNENGERTVVPLRDLPAGALNSNVLDLARFTQMVFADGRAGRQQILKPETLAEMLRYQDGDAPFDLHHIMGLAWYLDDRFGDAAGLIAGHDGATLLFNSNLMALPKHKLAVVIMTNSATAGETLTDIAHATLKLALETKTGIAVDDEIGLSDRVLPPKVEDLQALPGYYSTTLGIVRIKPAGDRFKVEVEDGKLSLVLRNDGCYHLQYKLLGLFPINLGRLERLGITRAKIAGRDVLVAQIESFRTVMGERIRSAPLPEAWQNRLGHYEVINPQDELIINNVELKTDDGLFLLTYTVRIPHLSHEDDSETIALAAVSEDEAIVHGLGRGKGGTIRVVRQNGEELLGYSGFLLRRIP
jgi:CubicO group peptidase (beta-lactamase class C family)